jgi:hypothetical protein
VRVLTQRLAERVGVKKLDVSHGQLPVSLRTARCWVADVIIPPARRLP